jgi:hypothetical protein
LPLRVLKTSRTWLRRRRTSVALSRAPFCSASFHSAAVPRRPPEHVWRPGTRPRWLSYSGLGAQEALRRPASSARRHA